MKYDNKFFDAQFDGSARSARKVMPIVLNLLKPTSVLDVGCGLGAWLKVVEEFGEADIYGLDGAWAEKAGLVIRADQFRVHDLGKPIDLGRRFDLVMSLEVAEHVSASSADEFVNTLCRHADTVLFSAAVPGQGGVLHVNEQPALYWIEKFQNRGYVYLDLLRPMIWHDAEIGPCYRQNMVLFATKQRAEVIKAAAEDRSGSVGFPTDVIHPQLLEERANFLAMSRYARAKFAAKLMLSLVVDRYRLSL